MIKSLGLPARELWLIAIVIMGLTGGIVAIAVAMPNGGSSRNISKNQPATDALGGIESEPPAFSSHPL